MNRWVLIDPRFLVACLLSGLGCQEAPEPISHEGLLVVSGPVRWFEPRLSSDSMYRPVGRPGDWARSLAPDLERTLALQALKADSSENAGVLSLLRGALDLSTGSPRGPARLEESLRQLRQANRESPRDPAGDRPQPNVQGIFSSEVYAPSPVKKRRWQRGQPRP